jgi:RimJ/RimL family protein N-acetyltransferase
MLKGKKVLLRAVTRDDLPRLLDFDNDLEVYALAGYHAWRPASLASKESEFDKRVEQRGDDVQFVIEVENVVIGSCGLTYFTADHRHCMLGISIGDKDYWGKGYGEDAVTVLLDYAFDHLNMHRVHLGVFSTNSRAQRLYRKLGFVDEGVDRESVFKGGRYIDNVRMGILDREWKQGPDGDRP